MAPVAWMVHVAQPEMELDMSETLNLALLSPAAAAARLTTGADSLLAAGDALADPLYQRLMAWEFEPLVDRLVEKEGFSEPDAREVFGNVKQFLYLGYRCEGLPSARMAPPESIDKAWHAFILFTRVYARFCHEHFGVFMHHTPFTRTQREAMRADGQGLRLLKATVAGAQDAFGSLGRFWMPQVLRIDASRFASDCEGCSGSTNCGGNDPSCW